MSEMAVDTGDDSVGAASSNQPAATAAPIESSPPSSWGTRSLMQWLKARFPSLRDETLDALLLFGIDGHLFLRLTEEDLLESEEVAFHPRDMALLWEAQTQLEGLERGDAHTAMPLPVDPSSQSLSPLSDGSSRGEKRRREDTAARDAAGEEGGEGGVEVDSEGRWVLPCISVDGDGNTFFTDKRIAVGGKGRAGGGQGEAAESGNAIGALSSIFPCQGMQFRTTPGNYAFDWHCAPRRQFVVNLTAAVSLEVSSGEPRVRVVPRGGVFLLEDVWGKGHRSKAVDGRARQSIFLPVPEHFHL